MKKGIIYISFILLLIVGGCGSNTQKEEAINGLCKEIMTAPDKNYAETVTESEEKNKENTEKYITEKTKNLNKYVEEETIAKMMAEGQVVYFDEIASKLGVKLKVKETIVNEGENNHFEFTTTIIMKKDKAKDEVVKIKGNVQISDNNKVNYFKITDMPDLFK